MTQLNLYLAILLQATNDIYSRLSGTVQLRWDDGDMTSAREKHTLEVRSRTGLKKYEVTHAVLTERGADYTALLARIVADAQPSTPEGRGAA